MTLLHVARLGKMRTRYKSCVSCCVFLLRYKQRNNVSRKRLAFSRAREKGSYATPYFCSVLHIPIGNAIRNNSAPTCLPPTPGPAMVSLLKRLPLYTILNVNVLTHTVNCVLTFVFYVAQDSNCLFDVPAGSPRRTARV